MNTELIPLVAAISAALIAGYFSFVTLINAKEQKTSEFRQAWIDGLRKEISDFTSSVYFSRYYFQQNAASNTDPAIINGFRETHLQYCSSCAAILLRINPQEPGDPAKEITDAFLGSVYAVQNAFNAADYALAVEKCSDVLYKAKPLLSNEWKKVKSGENGFRIIKATSIAMFFFAFIGMLYFSQQPFEGKKKLETVPATNAIAEKPDNTKTAQNCSLSALLESTRPITPSEIAAAGSTKSKGCPKN